MTRYGHENFGASVVIGTVLLVAISIILGTVLFVGFHNSGYLNQNPTASAAFIVDETPKGVELTMVKVSRGETFRVQVEGQDVSGAVWDSRELGEKHVISGVDSGDDLVFIGTRENRETVVQKYEIQGEFNSGKIPYVAQFGSISGPSCTVGTLTVTQDPSDGGMYRSISDAVNDASSGDVVEVCDSETYTEAVRLDKDITLLSAQNPVIDSDGTGASMCGIDCAVLIERNSQPTIDGFTIKSEGVGVYAIDHEAGWTIKNSQIRDTDIGIYGRCLDRSLPCENGPFTDTLLIENVTIEDVETAIDLENRNSYFLIKDSEIRDTEETAINLRSADSDWKIEDTRIVDTVQDGGWGFAVQADYMKGSPTFENVYIENTGTGIWLDRGDYSNHGSVVTMTDVTIIETRGDGIYTRAAFGRDGSQLDFTRVSLDDIGNHAIYITAFNEDYTGPIAMNQIRTTPTSGTIEFRSNTFDILSVTVRDSVLSEQTNPIPTVEGATNPTVDFQENCWYDTGGSWSPPTFGDHYIGNIDVSNYHSAGPPNC